MRKLKVMLLGEGAYCGLEKVEFPVEVSGVEVPHGIDISGSELIRIGARIACFDPCYDYRFMPWEFEEAKDG